MVAGASENGMVRTLPSDVLAVTASGVSPCDVRHGLTVEDM